MRVPRKPFSRRSRHRQAPPERMQEATRRAREEAQVVADRERAEARAGGRRRPHQVWSGRLGRRHLEGVNVRLRGAALETRRRLRPILSPALSPLASALGRVAPYISAVLLLLIRIPAALVAIVLDLSLELGRWVRGKLGPVLAGIAAFAYRMITPVSVVAVVAAAAAVALGVAEFFDYRGVAVGEPQYRGEVGTAAPVPLTGLDTAGSAHSYAMMPLAIAALVLIALTARGRWRLGRAVAAIGLIGIAVSLIVTAPEGLDAGRTGDSYIGAGAHLIEGFWAQVAASAVLALSGVLLGLYSKQAARERGALPAARRRSHPHPRRLVDRGARPGVTGLEAGP